MDPYGNQFGFYSPSQSSSNSRIIYFGNSDSPLFEDGSPVNEQQNEGKRSRSCPDEHMMAERKRRERLRQRIVALSAIIPGLRKMDKASILEDAIKYLKELQDRVRILEEEATRRTLGSSSIERRSDLGMDDFVSSNEEDIGNLIREEFPEIEAKVLENYVLVRVHCEKNQYGVPKIMAQIEKLNLNILSSNLLPFGSSSLDLTVVAQVKLSKVMVSHIYEAGISHVGEGLELVTPGLLPTSRTMMIDAKRTSVAFGLVESVETSLHANTRVALLLLRSKMVVPRAADREMRRIGCRDD